MGAGASTNTGETGVSKDAALAAVEAAFAGGSETVTIADIVNPPPAEEAPEEPDDDDEEAVAAEPEGLNWMEIMNKQGDAKNSTACQIKQIFATLDDDEDHILTKREFVRGLMDEGVPKRTALQLFKEIDTTRSKKITIAKFQAYQNRHVINVVRKAFKEADENGDRQIMRKELIRFFLNQGLVKNDAAALWCKIDVNGNGKINFKEFRDWAQDEIQEQALDSWKEID